MLSKFSVKKPYTVVVAVVLVIILGIVSFLDMTVDLLPSMNLPYAVVMTTYVGASPEEVEAAVTKPIEQSMATISNIANVSSTSQENASVVILQFEENANMDAVTVEMRESLDQISGYWPDTVGNPIIMKLNPDMLPVMVAAVSVGENDVATSSNRIEEEILPELESIEGVASVSTTGIIEETVEVTIHPDKVETLNQDIKESLDEKFTEASEALESAKAEVENGKKQLEEAQKEAAAQMGNAEAELAKKELEIQQGKAEIEEKLSELELSEVVLDAQLIGVNAQEAVLSAAKQELEILHSQESQIREEYQMILEMPEEEQTAELLVRRAELEAQIQVLDNYETLIAQADENLAPVLETKAQLDAAKLQIAEGKAMLKNMQVQLEEGTASLAEARGQLTSAQINTALQMSSAATQLALGEQTLTESITQMETTKDTAYKSADLTGILTKDMIQTILTAQNFNMPAGYVQEEGIDYLIRVGEKFKTIDDLRNLTLVNMDGVDPITLGDVATVEMMNNSSEVYTNINGEAGVMLTVQKQTGYATGDVSDRLLEKFEELESSDASVQFVTLMDQGVYIDLIVNSVLQNLLLGAVLAIIILLVFLKSVRPTFVIACSIPISLLTAIVLMFFSGITLNIISLSGLALGVGMLVDNSIVVIENIYRMRNEEGASAKEAAIAGAKEVAGAITASTLTTVCVFAPIVFTEGITRQLFVDMGLTIAYSLLASLVVSLTLVPMMAAGLLRKTETKESKFFGWLQKVYAGLLRKALKRKVIVLLLALIMLIGSAMLSMSKGTAFMPEMDSTQITLNLEMPKGTPLEETAEVSDDILEKVMAIPDVEDVGAMVSSGGMLGMGSAATNQVEMYAILKEDRELSNDELKALIEEETEGMEGILTVNTATMDMSALGSSGIVVRVTGRDLDRLRETAKEVAALLEGVQGTQNVSDGMGETTGELRIVVDKEKASEYNLTVAQVYQAVAVKLQTASSSTTLATDAKDYDVYVVDGANETLTRDDIRALTMTITKQDGTEEEIPLKDIVTFEDTESLQAINRSSQNRYVNVSAEIADGDNIGLVSNRVKDVLDSYEVPEGCRITMAGEDETIMEAMMELMKMLGLAVVFMYLIMVAQFQSLRSPFIIMFTIPLAFTGGFIGLFLTNSPVSVIAMIGFIMLSGIIVNNGIVFVDYANQLIYNGMEKTEALVEAGRTRVRPILMTALTTILGLSTMAMGLGNGAEMTQPMAIVTVGGLIYGTILTLFVVPCIYALFHGREKARLTEEIEAL